MGTECKLHYDVHLMLCVSWIISSPLPVPLAQFSPASFFVSQRVLCLKKLMRHPRTRALTNGVQQPVRSAPSVFPARKRKR